WKASCIASRFTRLRARDEPDNTACAVLRPTIGGLRGASQHAGRSSANRWREFPLLRCRITPRYERVAFRSGSQDPGIVLGLAKLSDNQPTQNLSKSFQSRKQCLDVRHRKDFRAQKRKTEEGRYA